jgi:hypothetical protein
MRLVIYLERLITFGQFFWYALANVNQIRKHDALANFRQNFAVFFFHSTIHNANLLIKHVFTTICVAILRGSCHLTGDNERPRGLISEGSRSSEISDVSKSRFYAKRTEVAPRNRRFVLTRRGRKSDGRLSFK